jgi:hypothetical protein
MKQLNLSLAALFFFGYLSAQSTIIPFHSTWKYKDDGSDQQNSWQLPAFDDSQWKTGAGQLGYGDGDERTLVDYGPDAQNKYITTYFRKTFTISAVSTYSDFVFFLNRDDGAVVFINGKMVFETNMPDGEINYKTFASKARDDGKIVQSNTLPASLFVSGENTIAVEIHQFKSSDNDISFDFELVANSSGNIAPVANAGADQTITVPNNTVTLNGSASSDADGSITSYSWSKISGPISGSITSPGSASTTVTALVEGTYTFRLKVTDDKGATASDDIVISVNATTSVTTYNAVDFGASWKYLDNGTDQGVAWRSADYADGSWKTGPGQLGYGDADEATVLGYGPDATDKYPTSYFRKLVTISNASSYNNFTLNVKRDDGIVVYINGIEVYRNNMPGGIINYNTLATGGAADDGDGIQTTTLANSYFINGNNIIAVEIHQWDVSNSDISFDLQLVANATTGQNLAPVARAGTDQSIMLPANSVTLDGSASSDPDGSISAYAWSKVSGPASGNITTPNTASTTVTGLVQGSYVFRLTITDNDGAKATDDISVTVNAATTNIAPTANAGSDQSITLPSSLITLDGTASSDADGSIASYAWSKVSGPASGTITSVASSITTVTGLVQGTYIYRLTVTDNDGAKDTDDLTVTVNPLTGSITLTRGPYLQMANGSAVTLRWRTDVATDSKISVGKTFGTYTISATNATSSVEHEVRITGLTADTKYYYSFGSTGQTLQAGTNNFFITAPPASTTRKMRIAVFGDCGRNESGFQTGTLSSYQKYVGSNPAELLLLLGDNAYSAGTDAEYTSNFFNVYSQNILQNHVVFPAPGNHDYASSSTRQTDHDIPYYDIFTMPAAAECGGVASGSEAFYSYNWGNIHFLSLDSYGYESGSTRLYDTLGPQVAWIKKDLAANNSKWTIAYWHHPPYTMGSHNSDTESELLKIRERFIGILERNGVDMILCGHSHDYERSYLLKDYTGNEASFSVSTDAVTSSSGKYDGSSNSCPYNLASGKVNHGTVYVVTGSAGADGSIQAGYPHNAMPFSVDDGGMLYFEVEDDRLDAKFIRRDGNIADKFTIVKDAGKTTSIVTNSGQAVTLTASWIGTYKWNTGATTQSITVSPIQSTNYTCNDGSGCLQDNFNVTVGQAITQMHMEPVKEISSEFTAYPTPVTRGQNLHIVGGPVASQLFIYNDKGQKIKQVTLQNKLLYNTSNLHRGMYYLKTEYGGKKFVRKIIVME